MVVPAIEPQPQMLRYLLVLLELQEWGLMRKRLLVLLQLEGFELTAVVW